MFYSLLREKLYEFSIVVAYFITTIVEIEVNCTRMDKNMEF